MTNKPKIYSIQLKENESQIIRELSGHLGLSTYASVLRYCLNKVYKLEIPKKTIPEKKEQKKQIILERATNLANDLIWRVDDGMAYCTKYQIENQIVTKKEWSNTELENLGLWDDATIANARKNTFPDGNEKEIKELLGKQK